MMIGKINAVAVSQPAFGRGKLARVLALTALALPLCLMSGGPKVQHNKGPETTANRPAPTKRIEDMTDDEKVKLLDQMRGDLDRAMDTLNPTRQKKKNK